MKISVRDMIGIVIYTIFIFMLFSSTGLAIYGGIESGALAWNTMHVWIWNNGSLFYWAVAAMTIGFSLAGQVFNSEDNKNKEEDPAGVLIVAIVLGLCWPVFWSYMFFYGIFSLAKKKEENDNS